MFRTFLVLLSLTLAPSLAQALQSNTPPNPPQRAPVATTPMFPNVSCPIMGKPISTTLYADTEMGRIYICCKSCVRDILDDVPTAYRTAYPTDKKVENKICPVTGKAIDKDSPTVVLQGFSFFVHTTKDVAKAREHAQIVLAKLNDPKLTDLENQTCPVSGEAVVLNAFVVIEGTIIRLSSTKLEKEIAKDPTKVLKKAKEIRAKEDKELEDKKNETRSPQDESKKL